MSNIIEGGTESYGSIVESVSGGADLYKRVRFKLDVLPRFARMPQSLPDMFTDTDLTPDYDKKLVELEPSRNSYFRLSLLRATEESIWFDT